MRVHKIFSDNGTNHLSVNKWLIWFDRIGQLIHISIDSIRKVFNHFWFSFKRCYCFIINSADQTGAEGAIHVSIWSIDKQPINNKTKPNKTKKNLYKNDKNAEKVDYSKRRHPSGWSAPVHPISCLIIKVPGETFKWFLLHCRSSVSIEKKFQKFSIGQNFVTVATAS